MAEEARWYIIHTYSGYENKVAGYIESLVENHKLQERIQGVRIPMETVTEIKDDGSSVEVERKMMPGYVLVKLAVEFDEDNRPQVPNDMWHLIRYTRGVTMTDDEVRRMGIEKKVTEVTYAVGDLVTVVKGPFEGFSGVVEVLDVDNNLVRVKISMFGRETPVEFELNQVKPAV